MNSISIKLKKLQNKIKEGGPLYPSTFPQRIWAFQCMHILQRGGPAARLASPQPPVFQTPGHRVASCPMPASPSFPFICPGGTHCMGGPELFGPGMPKLPCLILHKNVHCLSVCTELPVVRGQGWGLLGLGWAGTPLSLSHHCGVISVL